MKKSKKQRRKGKIYPSECRVPENSKERKESLPQSSMQRNRGKHRMGKTRGLFKKIRDTKGTFHPKMGSIKERNGMEAEDTKMRWKEYIEELYKRDLHVPDNHDGVITHLEPDILECEVKWALGSISMDDALKVLHPICQKIWKTQQWPQDWKRSVFIPIPKKGNAKKCSNYHTIVLISHVSKVIVKIL